MQYYFHLVTVITAMSIGAVRADDGAQGMPASDPSRSEAAAQPAVSDKAEQHALRVRGMKAAVADIENNQLWILNEVRAQRARPVNPARCNRRLHENCTCQPMTESPLIQMFRTRVFSTKMSTCW